MKHFMIPLIYLCVLVTQPGMADPVDDDPDDFLAEQGNKAAQKRLRLKREKAEKEQQDRAAAYAEKKQANEAKERAVALQQTQIKEQQRQQEAVAAAQKQQMDSQRESLDSLMDIGSRIGSLVH